MVARVILNGMLHHIDKGFDYLISPQHSGKISIGTRVIVPFGGGNRKKEGIVISLLEESSLKIPLKPVLDVIDEAPLLNDEMLKLIGFIKDRYFCTHYEAARLMFPPGGNLKEAEVVALSPDVSDEVYSKYYNKPAYKELLDSLSENDGELSLAELKTIAGYTPARFSALSRAGILVKRTSFKADVGDKKTKMIRLNMPLAASIGEAERFGRKNAGLYEEILSTIDEHESMGINEVLEYTGAGKHSLKTLEEKGIIEIFEQLKEQKTHDIAKEDIEKDKLSDEQMHVFSELKTMLDLNKAHCSLLYGVTGSGKTHVFLHLINRVISKGKTAMLLLPEISLTPQMMDFFIRFFGSEVALLHSAMTLRERFDAWKRIEQGGAKLVIGTRSAIFAPLKNIGLIIMDEEHDGSYQSENIPKYHAREIAKFRSARHNALLLLSSATPSFESFKRAKEGVYSLLTLEKRYNNAVLPDVKIVNLEEEIRHGNRSVFSEEMVQKLRNTLEEKKQAILFLNRRGYASSVLCMECGFTHMCKNCSVSLSYHADKRRLVCHLCGYEEAFPKICPSCANPFLKQEGIGTQKVQKELSELLPEAKILRMDFDSTKKRGSKDEIIESFAKGEADILIGTQMVGKGLNFGGVTFVGVLMADHALFINDYRSSETVFSLITQVIGRAGRSRDKGFGMIQTYFPQNKTIEYAAKQDYESFFKEEISLRQELSYPPFCDMFSIILQGPFDGTVKKGIEIIAENIRKERQQNDSLGILNVLGPAMCPVHKMNGRFRYRIILKCKDQKLMRPFLHHLLREFSSQSGNKQMSLIIECNPYQML